MTNAKKPFYREIDDSMYLVIEGEEDYRAFVLTDEGKLREVSSGYVLAAGNPITKETFCEEAKKIRAEVKATTAEGRSNENNACAKSGAAVSVLSL